MNKKNECDIVQDLLPNYIEKLTNQNTNQFIEEHLNNCSICRQKYDNMVNEIPVNIQENNKEEVNYFKKFNMKIKILLIIMIFILILLIGPIVWKIVIFHNISNNINAIKDENNYYIKQEVYCNGEMTISETYHKDSSVLKTSVLYSPNRNNKKTIIYKKGNECFAITGNEGNYTKQNLSDIVCEPPSVISKNLWENMNIAINTKLSTTLLKGEECYVITENTAQFFISKSTGLIRMIMYKDINSIIVYNYIYGAVKDTDIVKPSI